MQSIGKKQHLTAVVYCIHYAKIKKLQTFVPEFSLWGPVPSILTPKYCSYQGPGSQFLTSTPSWYTTSDMKILLPVSWTTFLSPLIIIDISITVSLCKFKKITVRYQGTQAQDTKTISDLHGKCTNTEYHYEIKRIIQKFIHKLLRIMTNLNRADRGVDISPFCSSNPRFSWLAKGTRTRYAGSHSLLWTWTLRRWRTFHGPTNLSTHPDGPIVTTVDKFDHFKKTPRNPEIRYFCDIFSPPRLKNSK